jgi:hypothetical protein
MMRFLKNIAPFAFLIFVIACGKLDSLLEGDDPPIIDRLVALRNQISPNDTTTVRAEARDPQGQALSYDWSATAGMLSSTTGQRVLWTAPANAGNYGVRVKVRNSKDKQTEASVTIAVIAGEAPTVKILQPTSGEYITGVGSALVEAVASHPNGIRDVEFWAGNRFLGVDNAAPFQQVWQVEGLSGPAWIVARAYRATAGGIPGVDSIQVHVEGVTRL